MFENCNALKSVYVNKFDVGSATVNNMFRNCYSITGGNGTKYSGSKSAYVRIDGGSAKPGYLNKVGWIKKGNKWTYKKLDGSLQTGWMNLEKKWYAFNANGEMYSACWVKSSGKWYYVNESGEMQTSKWLKLSNKWYYVGKDGIMQTGWQQINKKWYCFDASGVMQTSKWISNTYYVKADGTMAVSEWVDGGKYYVGADGKWIKGAKK